MKWDSSVQIGEIIRQAVAFNPRNWQSGSMDSDSLIQAVQDLFALLKQRQVRYVLVGGVALLYYVEGRNTQDLDLIMAISSLKKLPELKVSSRDLYFARASYGEVKVDVLLTQNPLFKRVYQQYSRVERFLDRKIPIATVEGLVLLKLYALPSLYRQGNFARVSLHENDIATLIYYYQPDVEGLLDELSRHVSATDGAELRNIVAELQDRIRRFRR